MSKRRARGDGTLLERSPGIWRLRVYAGTDTHGRPRQKSRTIQAKNRTEALKVLRAWAAEVSEEREARSKHTVARLLTDWLDHLERLGHAVSTIESYRLIAEKHLIPALGPIELHDLDGKTLDDYYAAKAADGGSLRTLKKGTGKGLGPNTIRVHHAVLSSALTQAVKWGWATSNAAEQASPPAKKKADRKAPEPEQVRALIDACGNDPDLAIAISLGAITGARRGELCGLQWHDVDWERATLHIVRQRQPGPGGDRTVPPKTKRPPISLGPGGIALLRRYREVVEERAVELGVVVSVDGWLISPDGGRSATRAKGLGAAISDLSARSGVRITTHLLRYFAATQMVGAGVDPRTAAGRLGHSPEILLRVYSDFMPRRDLEAATGLEALVLPPTTKAPDH